MLAIVLPLLVCIAPSASADTTPAAQLEVDVLVSGLMHEKPDLSPENARAHVMAALGAGYREFGASVELGLALRESDLRLDADPQCGVLQATRTEIGGRANCTAAQTTVIDSYRLGMKHLAEDLELCRTWQAKGRLALGVDLLRCTLNLYAEGGAAARRGWGVKGCKAKTHCDRSAVPLAHAHRIEAGARDIPPSV